jgi:ribonuclease Z
LLKVQLGLRDANKIYGILKMMKSGDIFTLPDGHVIKADDVLDPPRLGRKIVIMGDTCSGDLIAPLAEGADLLIHEATNAWIREFDQSKYSNYVNLEKDTFLLI